MPETTHEGNDPMGAPTSHRGSLENCPAPDCQDRIAEQQDQTDLRERIALAMHSELTELPVQIRRQSGLIVPPLTNAVLRMLPPPADRAAVYAEVAARLLADAEEGAKDGFTRIYRRSAADRVRVWANELAAETQTVDTGRIVAYRSPQGRSLYCTRHVDELFGAVFTPVTSDDLPDGGLCTFPDCGVDVLIPQEADRD